MTEDSVPPAARYVGKKQTPEYIAWRHMLARCHNHESDAYEDYGGRGITVCQRWHSFDHFIADMGRRPYPNATLERLDVDGNYDPSNVVWLPHHLQNRNKRNTIWVEHNGQRKCLKQVAEEEGISYVRLWKRTQRQGLSLAEALSRGTDRVKHRFEYEGQQLTIADIATLAKRPSGSVHHDLLVKKLSVQETLARV